MRSKLTQKTLIISAVLLFAGAAIVFAQGGYGRGGYGGHMMDWGPGYGGHMMGYGHGHGWGPGHGKGMGYGPGHGSYGRGYGADLTEEQRAKLDQAREKFFEQTEKLRDQIEDKRYALGTEMRKDNPDTDKVTTLRKELSQLESDFDQQAVLHQLEMRKLLPEDARRGFGRGYGGGYCWR